MSQENVEALKRGVDAANRRDIESFLETLDPEVEWHPGLAALLEGEATIYRGREEVREMFQDYFEAFADLRFEIESPWAYLIQVRNGKATHVRTYLDPKEALEAAGLRE